MTLVAISLAACAGPKAGSDLPSTAAASVGQYSLGSCHTLSTAPATKEDTLTWLADGAQRSFDTNLVGADVAASAMLPGRRLVFVFGDTTRSSGVAVRNSISIADGACSYTVIAPARGATVPDRTDGVGYWPMSVLVGPTDGGITEFTVMMQRVVTTGGAEFENLGPALAVFSIGNEGAPQLVSVTEVGPDNPSKSKPCWGAATYSGNDGYWYVYGTESSGKEGEFGWGVKVARMPAGRASDLTQWQYWDGSGWGARESDAVEILAAKDGVSQTFSVFTRGGLLYMLSKKGGFLGSDLAVWPMDGPAGPMAPPVTVGLIPNSTDPSVLYYMPLAHPELPTATPESVIVSVSRNSTDLRLLAKEPELYRPFFLEVALPPRESQQNLTPAGT